MTLSSSSAAARPTPLTIDVWSDVVCPWCYIGKRRLESALEHLRAQRSDLTDVQIRWRSFQLDPSAPSAGEAGHGVGVASHLGAKYGGGLRAGQAMTNQITEVAAGEGLDFHLDDAVVGNTVDAHRLLHLASDLEHEDLEDHGGTKLQGLQGRVKERFLKAYFVEGLDVSDPDVLRSLALEEGMPTRRVAEVLRSPAYAKEVHADQAQAQSYGANGVPFTVVDGRYGISGAQPVEAFVGTIERALADRASQLVSVPTGAASGTATCGPEGC
ncbi:MAG: DsbA family oxidoreductase [Ornithinimicrobium sp.]